MSRHTFALSVLLCSLASLILLAPVQGQLTVGISPARPLSPMSHHGFFCVFDYDFYDYSDYDYNDYSYSSTSTSNQHDGVFYGCDAEFCETSPHADAAILEAAASEPTASNVDDMINYGCAGYCYDDYDLYGYEYDESYEGLYGSYSDCECYDEMYEDVMVNEVAKTTSREAADLVSTHDALYDEVVYGVLPEIVCEDPLATCATYAWGSEADVDAEMSAWIEETAADTVAMIRDASARIVESGAKLQGRVRDFLVQDQTPPAATALEWNLDDTLMISLGVLTDTLPRWDSVDTSTTQQRVLVETAETLEGAADVLRGAANQLRRLAQGDRLTWKGVPYRR